MLAVPCQDRGPVRRRGAARSRRAALRHRGTGRLPARRAHRRAVHRPDQAPPVRSRRGRRRADRGRAGHPVGRAAQRRAAHPRHRRLRLEAGHRHRLRAMRGDDSRHLALGRHHRRRHAVRRVAAGGDRILLLPRHPHHAGRRQLRRDAALPLAQHAGHLVHCRRLYRRVHLRALRRQRAGAAGGAAFAAGVCVVSDCAGGGDRGGKCDGLTVGHSLKHRPH
ncbi:hypothetical protein CBM2587_A150105 [Cupriavidus taiwanensis]|uniref:Uncharacterized protein n=1 Tax=Cupriavidus taiwanensis TaxID=164546 RepID=A0A375BI57_9BURK|nr:hypothetical protein CBM2587_A150105 [Cupriavidus taiwanensis]